MVPPINIDISDFVRQWQLTAEESDMFVWNLLNEVGTRFADQWKNEAGKVLKQTKQQYQRAIYIEKPDYTPQSGRYSLVVGLAGWLPNAVEQGLEPFDMKPGFKGSDKKKYKKDGGWYLTVPFRFANPEALGESTVFANVMPGKVYEVAKTYLRDKRTSLQLSQLPDQFRVKRIRPEVTNLQTRETFKPYQHKAPIYEGMKNMGAEGHSQYMTFRRVSDLSDPMAWIHTGIQPAGLMEKTLNNFPLAAIIAQVKADFLEQRRPV